MAEVVKGYYFGCVGQAGHYMHTNGPTYNLEDRRALALFTHQNPWGLAIDDGLRPRGGSPGQAALHHKDGWTAIAFVDYSVDNRPGSNSAFLFKGTHDFEEMVSLAKHYFPAIVGRFNFTISEYKAA